jgi:hypothetical protein
VADAAPRAAEEPGRRLGRLWERLRRLLAQRAAAVAADEAEGARR